MGLDASWNLVGVPSDARDAARAAAMREGLSVGEWLTRRILRNFSELNSRIQGEAYEQLSGRLIELADQVEQLEGQLHGDQQLREDVRGLHQDLSRLAEELVQTAGRSAIQISTLTAKVESLAGSFDDIRGQMSGASVALEQRVELVQQNLDNLEVHQFDASRSLAGKLESFTARLDEVRRENSGTCGAVEERLSSVQQNLDELSVSQRDTARSLAGKLASVTGRLDEVRKEASETCGTVEQHLTSVQQSLEELSARQRETTRSLGGNLETLTANLARLAGEASQRSDALDQRLTIVRQDLENQSASQSDVTRELAARVDGFGGRLGDVRFEASQACRALDQRVALAQQDLENLDARQNDATRALADNLDTLTARLDSQRAEGSARSEALEQRLDGKLESLAGKLDGVTVQASRTHKALDRRVTLAQQKVESLDVRHSGAVRSVARNLASLAGMLDRIRAEGSGRSEAIEQRLELVQRSLDDKDRERDNAIQPLADNFKSLSGTVEELRNAASARSEAIEQRVANVQRSLEERDGEQDKAIQPLADNLKSLSGTIENLRNAASARSEAIEQRLTSVQRGLEELGARQSSFPPITAASLESINSRLEKTRAEASDASAALEQRVSLVQQGLKALDIRLNDSPRSPNDTAEGKAVTAAILNLEKEVAGLKARLGGQATESRFAALERSLSELMSRTDAAEQDLNVLAPKANGASEMLTALNERLDADGRKQQDAMEELRASLLDETQKALNEHLKTVGKVPSDPVQEAPLVPASSFAQPAIEEAQHSDAPGTSSGDAGMAPPGWSVPITAAADSQPLMRAELLAAQGDEVAAEPVQVHEEPQAVLSAADQDDAAPMETGTPPPAADLRADNPKPNATFDHDADMIVAPPFPDTHILESNIADGTPNPEPELPKPADSLGPNNVDDQPHSSVTYLAAARRSLQAAAARADSDPSAKDYFGRLGLGRLGFGRFFEKVGSETTSYALVAGIVLIAILAMAVTVGELLNRSTSVQHARIGNSLAAAKYHAARTAQFSRSPAPKSVLPDTSTRGALPDAAQSPAPALSSVAAGAPGTTSARPAQTAPIAVPPSATPPPTAVHASEPLAPTEVARIRSLAERGDAHAQTMLGLYYAENGNAENDAEAAKWFERAAAQGEAEAQFRLATLYAAGHGVPTDLAKAVHWYQTAAELGNRRAMSNLAVAYAQGSGTAKDLEGAVRWFSRAAELGLTDAQFDLAVLYERGLGVPQSLPDAYRWYVIAARQGDRESKNRVEALAAELSPHDREAAEAGAAQFSPLPMNERANELPKR